MQSTGKSQISCNRHINRLISHQCTHNDVFIKRPARLPKITPCIRKIETTCCYKMYVSKRHDKWVLSFPIRSQIFRCERMIKYKMWITLYDSKARVNIVPPFLPQKLIRACSFISNSTPNSKTRIHTIPTLFLKECVINVDIKTRK